MNGVYSYVLPDLPPTASGRNRGIGSANVKRASYNDVLAVLAGAAGVAKPVLVLVVVDIVVSPEKYAITKNGQLKKKLRRGSPNEDGFMLCFYRNTDHVFNYMLLMQTTTSGITQSTGKSKHNKHKSSSSITCTYQESTTTTTKKSAAAYLRMRVRMQLHLKKKKIPIMIDL